MTLNRPRIFGLFILTMTVGALFSYFAWSSHVYWANQPAYFAPISSRIWLAQGFLLTVSLAFFWIAVAAVNLETRVTFLALTFGLLLSFSIRIVDHGKVNALNSPLDAQASSEFTARATRVFGTDSKIHLTESKVKALASAGSCAEVELVMFDLAASDGTDESGAELDSKLRSLGLLERGISLCEQYKFNLELVASFQSSVWYRSVSADLRKAFP